VGVLIDSSVIVAAERGELDTEALLGRLGQESAALAAITVSELLHGVYRANTTARRKRRAEFVEGLLERIAVLPFDLAVARTHAAIWADLARSGTLIGAHDLLIAATALTFQLSVATKDERAFRRVEGLAVDVW
jgi:predicted nucleic acid-binding protein